MARKANSKKNALLGEHLRNEIRDKIVARLTPGSRLPPQAQICKRFGVSPGTVVSAMKELEEAGLVIRQHGRGTFVADTHAPHLAILLPPRLAGLTDIEKRVREACRAARVRCEIHDEVPSHLALLRDRVQGVVCIGTAPEDSWFRQLSRQGVPVVTDANVDFPRVDHVGKDSFATGKLAAETLLAAGHRRIAYIGAQPYDEEDRCWRVEPDSELHQAGVTAALLHEGIEPDPEFSVRFRITSPHQERPGSNTTPSLLRALMAREQPPTAMIYFDMGWVGNNMTQSLADAGLRIPNDMSVITLGYLEDQAHLTMVGCAVKDLLEQAILQLQMRIRLDHGSKQRRFLVSPSVIEHGSVAKPRKGE